MNKKSWAGIEEFQVYLFNEGTNYKSYQMLGPHKIDDGWRFAVWAPHAERVSLVGDFNGWNTTATPLTPIGTTGVWYCVISDLPQGAVYKYAITNRSGGVVLKADPFAFESELRPNTASVVRDIPEYKWTDSAWLKKRASTQPYDKPMLIYELHAGSWKQHSDGSFYSYAELADELIPYVKDMGYTHIELMPLTEYPYDGSWGYQVTGFFSATSRYGKPEELMCFVDKCHKNKISVIMDWVPAHFPRDEHGLFMFDGTPTYEYADPRMGEHKDWGTMVFDYSKSEVVAFLLSSAHFWVDVFHFDGLRVDAVSSMLYRDYSRRDGEWVANIYGGNENIEAIEFLRNLNTMMFSQFPNILMIAEESTAWGMVTGDVKNGGLGFNYKWNMGWMHDTLTYMSMDYYFRGDNHNLLTFLMFYAYSENFILPLSHDEVVHGKHSLVDKMFGPYEDKLSAYKALLGYYLSLPGKKLMFMGGDIAQFIEWRFDESLEWHLLENDNHKRINAFIKAANHFYTENKAFWEIDRSWDGFEWLNDGDSENSVISYMRKSKRAADNVYVVANFRPVRHKSYVVGLPAKGDYEVVLNSAWREFGGERRKTSKVLKAVKKPHAGKPYSIKLDLDGLSVVYIKRIKNTKKSKENT